MATTTNYGWTTPDDTALVKDGASAIRTLGSSIDTTVFNNANAAIAKTIVDAKGDIIAATAADTVARLAVGANDTVLTADSSTATGLKWATVGAGGMTTLTSGTLSGSEVDLTSITGTYRDLILRVYNFKPATDERSIRVRFNNDTSTNYFYGTQTIEVGSGSTFLVVTDNSDNTDANGVLDMRIINYASTSYNKLVDAISWVNNATTPTNMNLRFTGGIYISASAITSIKFYPATGNFTSGNYELIGVK